MKKRLFALLMAMVMLLGMGIVSHAEANTDEVRYFKCDGRLFLEKRGYGEAEDFRGEIDFENGIVEIGVDYQIFTFDTRLGSHRFYSYPMDEKKQDFDGLSFEFFLDYRLFEFYGDTIEMMKTAGNQNEEAFFSISPSYPPFMNVVEFYPDETEPAIHEISAPFTGTAVSDREEYTLALAGYFEKELTDGTHELSLDEIKEQTISIVAYNKANGVKRVMTQSTIEEMSVTVSGGEVTQYVIRGRVQTNGGKLDRYTAVIEK